MNIPLLNDAEYPRLVFAHDVDDRDMAPHGYRGDVVLELADGEAFPVYFYEPDAVCEELEGRRRSGLGQFVAEPGLVVIPDITLANMKSSMLELLEVGYFAHKTGLLEGQRLTSTWSLKSRGRVVLTRDMTDTMYNPKSWSYVAHFQGTELIIQHIEKFVRPTI